MDEKHCGNNYYRISKVYTYCMYSCDIHPIVHIQIFNIIDHYEFLVIVSLMMLAPHSGSPLSNLHCPKLVVMPGTAPSSPFFKFLTMCL